MRQSEVALARRGKRFSDEFGVNKVLVDNEALITKSQQSWTTGGHEVRSVCRHLVGQWTVLQSVQRNPVEVVSPLCCDVTSSDEGGAAAAVVQFIYPRPTDRRLTRSRICPLVG